MLGQRSRLLAVTVTAGAAMTVEGVGGRHRNISALESFMQ